MKINVSINGNKTEKVEIPGIEEEDLEEFEKLFCECEEHEDPKYVENYMGVNHGWICQKCKKFVQIG